MSQFNFLNSSNTVFHPSFLIGFFRAFDLFGTYTKYNFSDTDQKADSDALKKDWEDVGQDLQNAIKGYESKNSKS